MNLADKLTTIAENQQKVYDAGYTAGLQAGGGGGGNYEEGYRDGYEEGEVSGYQSGYADGNDDGRADGKAEGIEEGKQAEYDRIWDAIQSNGNRKYYDQAFTYTSGTWNDETFQPKYDIVCEGSDAFRQTFTNSLITSTKVPIRCKNTRIVYTFQNCVNLKTIPLLTLEGITQITNAFNTCYALENITIAGEIPLSISFAASTRLTKASIVSVVNALSSGVSGYTLTLSKTAVDTAFGYYENGELVTPGSLDEPWALLVESKPNWTISLV